MVMEIQPRVIDLKLDINKPNKDKITIIKGDYNVFNISLYDGETSYPIGDNEVQIIFRLSNRTTVQQIMEVGYLEKVDAINGKIKLRLKDDSMACVGGTGMEVRVTNGLDTITSARASFTVEKGLFDDTVLESGDKIPLLNRLVQTVELLDVNLKDAETLRVQTFNTIVNTADTTKTGLDVSIIDADTIKGSLDDSIQEALAIDELLDNPITGTIKKSNDIKIILDDLITDAESTNIKLHNTNENSKATKNNLDSIVATGGTVISDLNENIGSANLINDLLANVETGNIKKANDINSGLGLTIGVGNDTKDNLNIVIGNANTSKDNLNLAVEIAGTKKTDLDGSVANANTKKGELIETIGIANTSKSSLDGSVTLGNATKTNLDGSISTGQTLKNNLDTFIADGAIIGQIMGTTQPTKNVVWLKVIG